MPANKFHIGLLRHGEVLGGPRFRGSTDDPLTATGWLQLWNAVDKTDIRWEQVITSPLKRCVEFAWKFGAKYSLPVYVEKRFQEIHFGEWEDCTVSDILLENEELINQYWIDPIHNTPPKAESLIKFKDRVMSGWNEFLSAGGNKNTLIITHAGVIRIILCHLLNHPIDKLLALPVNYALVKQFVVEDGLVNINTAGVFSHS